jgi:hypothetical protein
MTVMKYQLVLQLPAVSLKDYDEIVELEEDIIRGLGKLGTVDGHDAGLGEMNIFILTDYPKAAFDRVKGILGKKLPTLGLKVAFRVIGADEFTVLHPADLAHFSIA